MTFFTELMIYISVLGSLPFLIFVSLAVIFILLKQKKKNKAFLLICSLFGGAMLTFLIKNIIQRPRPVDSLITITGYSFPSGHALQSIIFYSLVILIFQDQIKNNILKHLFVFSNIVFILLIGLSRIYLKVHWISDVIAGYILGIVWLIICMLSIKETRFLLFQYVSRKNKSKPL